MNKKFFLWAIAFFVLVNIVVIAVLAGKNKKPAGGAVRHVGRVSTKTTSAASGAKAASKAATKAASKTDGNAESTEQETRIDPLFIKSSHATSPSFGEPRVNLRLNEKADLESLKKGISFTPHVDFNITLGDYWPDYYADYEITGNFEHGKSYTLKMKKGTKGGDGDESFAMSDMSFNIEIPDVRPTVEFAGSGRYLAPFGERVIPVQAVNVTNISVSIDCVLPQNFLQFIMRDNKLYKRFYSYSIQGVVDDLSRNVAKFDVPIASYDKNTTAYIPLALKSYLSDFDYGAFLVSVKPNGAEVSDDDDDDSWSDQMLVCMTDIGISARLDPDAAHIWITSLLKGTARSGVTVALFSDKNEVIGTTVSGSNGYVKIPYPEDMNPVAVIVCDQRNDDVSFLPLTSKAQISIPSSANRSYLTGTDCEAFIFTDRGIYRPGETVFIEGILRERKFNAPTPFPVVLRVSGPDGKEVSSVPLTPSRDGSFSHEFSVKDTMRTGRYRFDLATPGQKGIVLGSKSVSVESFVPPQIKVAIDGVPEKIFHGTSNFTAKVSSEYLFGGKAPRLKLDASCIPSLGTFAPPNWQNFKFCKSFDAKTSFSPIKTSLNSLDDEGFAEPEFDLTSVLSAKCPVNLCVQASVLENGGRSVTETKKLVVHPCPYYLGLSLPSDEAFAGDKPVQVLWTALDPEGKLVFPDGDVHAELYRVDNDWECTEGQNGTFEWRHIEDIVPIDKALKVSRIDATGTGSITVNPLPFGEYRIVLVDDSTGVSTAASFDTLWWGDESDSRAAEAGALTTVKITFDKEEYKPGDIARIRIDSPFDGELWFTMHNTRILASYTFPVRNKALEFTLKINETLAPNIEVSATVVRPTKVEEVWMPHRASGNASLNVRPVSHELDVAIKCEEAIKPLSTLAGTVEVKDNRGKPVSSAKVTVFAVDEGICRLTKHVVPDPAAFFRQNRRSGMEYFDIYSDLMKVTDMSLVGFVSHTGGDELGSAENALLKRMSLGKGRRFKPVALRAVDVPVFNGVGNFSIDVPEFSGSLRVMAVAWNESAVGSSETFTSVKRDIVLEADMARFLASGDSSSITLSLFNTTDAFRGVRYSVSVADGPVVLTGECSGVSAIGPGEGKVVTIPVSATHESGVAKLVCEVDTLSDKFVNEIEIPVRPAVALQTQASTMVLAPSNSCRIAFADGFFPATVSQRFDFLAFPACDVRNALSFLTEYPYGCLEQTTSRGFPFINAKRLPAGYLPAGEIARADTYIQHAIDRIGLMKRENGFAMWPDVLKPNAFATLYAVHFLAEARRAGYDIGIDVAVLQSIMLANLSSYTDFAACYAHLNLALLGRPAFAEMTTLASSGRVSNEGMAILARAFIVGGQPSKGRDILSKKVYKPKTLREAAFILIAWSEVNPNSLECIDAIKVINRFIDQGRRHWGTTQDNALATFAMTSYMSTRTAYSIYDKATAKIEIFDGFGGRSSTMNFPEAPESSWEVPRELNSASFIVSNPGMSTLFVNHTVSGIPIKEPAPENHGMKVERRYYTTEGKEAKLSAFKRGDLVAVQIVGTFNANFSDVVIEDLLPACLEVEKGNAASLNVYQWMKEPSNWVLHSEIRDDRVLLFTDSIADGDKCTWYYIARVVSSGDFAVPAITASAMYDPKAFSRGKSSSVSIK